MLLHRTHRRTSNGPAADGAPSVTGASPPDTDLATEGIKEAVPRWPLRRRQRVFIQAVIAAIIFATGGVVGSLWIKSPQQLAAEQAPPEAAALTAPVVQRVLTRSVVVRGTVSSADSITMTPTAVQGASRLVISATPMGPGDRVNAGDVVLEVSGRPIIALAGVVPAYRDLKPGASGRDIGQLQDALRSLGHQIKDRAGLFGDGTKKAVAALYRRLGYEPATTGGTEEQATLDAATTSVRTAERQVTTAQAALDGARSASPPPEAPTVAQAQQALEDARAAADSARRAQARLIATTGVQLPQSEVLFVPSFPATVSAIKGDVGSTVVAPLLGVSVGAAFITATLDPADASSVRTGMAVTINAETLGAEVAGTVESVSPVTADTSASEAAPPDGPTTPDGAPPASPSATEGPTQESSATLGHQIVVKPTETLDSKWIGVNVRLTIAAASTVEPALVVPVAAVSTSADGTVSVTVKLPDGGERRIAVVAGLDAGGYVAVTPVAGSTLAVGDLVVIGR